MNLQCIYSIDNDDVWEFTKLGLFTKTLCLGFEKLKSWVFDTLKINSVTTFKQCLQLSLYLTDQRKHSFYKQNSKLLVLTPLHQMDTIL